MRVRSVLYHDVVDGNDDSSGFPGAAAARYKLTRAEFAGHLTAMAAAAGVAKPVTFAEVSRASLSPGSVPWLITFDDGGSSFMHIADALESHGWRGNFFITTGGIGTPAFLTAADIRELDHRGHGIGSHSATHPYRISRLPEAELAGEWATSCAALADILGKPLFDASVPGGYYAPRVAEAAANAGIRQLYTSEPTAEVGRTAGCTIFGRYCVYRGMSANHAAALARGALWATGHQKALWKAKGAVKSLAAPIWEFARKRAFAQR